MDNERIEIEALFSDLYRLYGYDFRNYYYDLARRKILHLVALNHLQSISNLRNEIINNTNLADDLIRNLSINVTEMFRDPDFFLELRNQVLPKLHQYEHIKIWHAGCATGEEVYSMAILLTEENLYSKSLLYATDFNNTVLDQAKRGIISLANMRSNIKNYQAAGGMKPFSNYYHSDHNAIIINNILKKNTIFSHHNLVTDNHFTEVEMIICRNVLIYFDKELQKNVFKLFYDSLKLQGILCLGTHETLQFSGIDDYFELVSTSQRIYRKIK